MTLHISEIGIHLAIAPSGPATGAAAGGAASAAPQGPTPEDTEALVKRCVAEVLAQLHAREAR